MVTGTHLAEPLLCDRLFLGSGNTQAYPDRKKVMTDQNTDTTTVWFSEPKSFIGVIYRNMGEMRGYLQGQA